MTIIYEPKGKAGEYCKLAINLYRGCGHGCKYCYAPLATRTCQKEFYKNPQPRQNVIEKLARQLEKNSFTGPVLLCFTCDPYQPVNDDHDLTGQAIRLLKANDISIEIVTKGGLRGTQDLDQLGPEDKIGATLTFTNNMDSHKWEPGAALPEERFMMLKIAKEKGIGTWASLEPVIDPEQSLEIIKNTHKFIDVFKVGKLNYHPHAERINWPKFAADAVDILKKNNCNYLIKKDLRIYLDKIV